MKRIIGILLVAILLTTGFTACKQAEIITPTDAPVKESQPTTESQPSQLEQETDDSKEPVQEQEPASSEIEEEKDESAKEPEQEAKPADKEDKKEDVKENQSTQTIAPENVHADLAIEHPNFTSTQALEQWIKTGSGQYETERNEMLQSVGSGQTITYYRPSKDLSEYVILQSVSAEFKNTELVYRYSFADDKQLRITPHILDYPFYTEDYENYKKWYEEGLDNYGHIHDEESGIDYYYELANFDITTVQWMQFGKAHSASFEGHKDILKELIPLFQVEKVTVQINSNHVTQ